MTSASPPSVSASFRGGICQATFANALLGHGICWMPSSSSGSLSPAPPPPPVHFPPPPCYPIPSFAHLPPFLYIIFPPPPPLGGQRMWPGAWLPAAAPVAKAPAGAAAHTPRAGEGA
eukprot:6014648-Pyramimonas_sp.AAC.1